MVKVHVKLLVDVKMGRLYTKMIIFGWFCQQLFFCLKECHFQQGEMKNVKFRKGPLATLKAIIV